MIRYLQLNHAVSYLKPARILEVGTWVGQRAFDMYTANPNKAMEYVGIDLWEGLTDEISARELNAKPRIPLHVVQTNLNNIGLKCSLFKGFSEEELPKVLSQYGEKSFPFIYIDGGHSVETIRKDLLYCVELISPGGLIVMDDYYTEVLPEFTDRWGCNRVLESTSNIPFYLWPLRDPLRDGGFVQMAVLEFNSEKESGL